MDMSTIMAAYESAKAAGEILSAIRKLKVDSEVLGRITDVQQRLAETQDGLFAAQSEMMRLQSENAALTQKVASLEDWKQRFAQYELTSTRGGAVVYSFKGNPHHYACPSCVEKSQVQILQDRRSWAGTFSCPACKGDYPVNPEQRASDPYGSLRRPE